MRLLLAALVGLAQVAGPWLCCCGPARAAVTVAVPAAPPVESCPHCKRPQPADPAPALPAPCPCGGKVSDPTVPPKTDPPAVGGFTPPALPLFARPTPLLSVPAFVGASDLPFLPPGTRLFVHHALRC